MARFGFDDAEPPRRPRRGPPPRLYVIARRSPFPWLRVRRLGAADLPALVAHFVLQAAAVRSRALGAPDEAGIAALCAGLDFSRVVIFGAVAGNAVVAAACGAPGLQVAATEDPDYRDRALGAMLVSQVLGAGPDDLALASPPNDAEGALLRLIRSFQRQSEPAAALAQSA